MTDFEQFARLMRLQYIFHWENSDLRPFLVTSDWITPIQPSVTLESYLEEVKISLANIQVRKPKVNLLSLTPNPPRSPVFLHTYKDSQTDSSW